MGLAWWVAAPAWAWAPLTAADGEPLAWPAEAWPLPLTTTHRADRTAAAGWSGLGPACFAPQHIAAPQDAADGVIAVIDVSSAAWAATVGDPGLVAFTLITHEAGRLLDADVLLNSERFPLTTDGDPRQFGRGAVLQHELGHALGLGHPCGAPGAPCAQGTPTGDAAMAPTLGPGEAPALTTDDQAGLAAVSRCEAPGALALGPPAAGPEGWRVPVRPVGDSAPGPLRAGWWGAEGAWHTAAVSPDATIVAPRAAVAVEAWSAQGRGAVQALAPPGQGVSPGPAPAGEVGGGCQQGRSGGAPDWWAAMLWACAAWRAARPHGLRRVA